MNSMIFLTEVSNEQSIIHSQEASRGDASACFSNPAVYFLANFRYDISKKVVVLSRIMRKFICRLRLNEVSRQ
mgnify:CR=1 FL=1